MSTRTYGPAPLNVYPPHLAAAIQAATGLPTLPQVDVALNRVAVTHDALVPTMDSAVQATVDAYVHDPDWGQPVEDAFGKGLRAKAQAVFSDPATNTWAANNGADGLQPVIRKLLAALVLKGTR